MFFFQYWRFIHFVGFVGVVFDEKFIRFFILFFKNCKISRDHHITYHWIWVRCLAFKRIKLCLVHCHSLMFVESVYLCFQWWKRMHKKLMCIGDGDWGMKCGKRDDACCVPTCGWDTFILKCWWIKNEYG